MKKTDKRLVAVISLLALLGHTPLALASDNTPNLNGSWKLSKGLSDAPETVVGKVSSGNSIRDRAGGRGENRGRGPGQRAAGMPGQGPRGTDQVRAAGKPANHEGKANPLLTDMMSAEELNITITGSEFVVDTGNGNPQPMTLVETENSPTTRDLEKGYAIREGDEIVVHKVMDKDRKMTESYSVSPSGEMLYVVITAMRPDSINKINLLRVFNRSDLTE